MNQPTSTPSETLSALIYEMINQGFTRAMAVDSFERAYVEVVLTRNKINQSKAAREAGVHRNTVGRMIEKHQLNVEDMRRASGRKPAARIHHGGTEIRRLAS
jgi:transcriptional regulator with GAF, ATPase, and Fis domain